MKKKTIWSTDSCLVNKVMKIVEIKCAYLSVQFLFLSGLRSFSKLKIHILIVTSLFFKLFLELWKSLIF